MQIALEPRDIERLHLILYAGSWPLPKFLTDTDWAEMGNHGGREEIASINRLRKAGWVSVAEQSLWLTPAALNAAYRWLDHRWATSSKRIIAKHYKRPLLKHRIPWLQIASLYLRDEAIKTPPARWFSPQLKVQDSAPTS